MKKIEKIAVCCMVIFAFALMTACSTNNGSTGKGSTGTTAGSTLQPTTGSSTSGPATGPTNGLDGTDASGMRESKAGNAMESTGVIGGLADDLKKGVDDIEDGVDHAVDHSAAESSVGH